MSMRRPLRGPGNFSRPVVRRRPGLVVLAWLGVGLGLAGVPAGAAPAPLRPVALGTEYLTDPQALETPAPRLSWRVESDVRGQKQTAYRVLVATSAAKLARRQGDLWDSGKVATNRTTGVVYAGRPLSSRQSCWWQVQVWDKDGRPSGWSEPARWSMGLLAAADWQAQWIAARDATPLHRDRNALFLPPARHYRREFAAPQPVRRAVLYISALGLYEAHLNGQRVGDSLLTPGWSDYKQRAYYQAYDVTGLLRPGANALGVIVADGWYAGYVGYGLLVGYGPHKTGRGFYGKTPALLAQLELEYADGTRTMVGTDTAWRVTDTGPIREADLIMGERHDARRELGAWSEPGFDAGGWAPAIRAEENGPCPAPFFDTLGQREVQLGFEPPRRLEAYPGPPVRVVQEISARRMTTPAPGTFILDLGQNFAGIVRLKVKGPPGAEVRLRYGEMLHPDGRLMTENLRRARATDTYILRGDPAGEVWTPRFTYHGFQYVELTGLAAPPELGDVTGLVVQSDTPLASRFACSDDMANRLFSNIVWTQRANFVELPTDCPQRDERLGWMGDAQIYVRAATYNADVAAFFTKWLEDVEEAQRDFGAYPDYCPYPMAHGEPGKTFGTAWTDAGIVCPWTVWQVYGDTRVLERHWDSMQRFMQWREKNAPDGRGVALGNSWGDWLNVGENTPIEYIDAAYYALDAQLMAGMGRALGRSAEAARYEVLRARVAARFRSDYLQPDGVLKVDTQTAHVLALSFGLLPGSAEAGVARRLADKIARNGGRMATGFLGTKPLLPALSAHGHHDLAVRLFQSRQFPSWGYEVVNGATTVWERWDSYTKEDGFGRHNAAMNSFSHYSFGAVCEWMFSRLAGIDTDGPGFQRLLLRPGPPAPGSNPDQPPIDWVRASYDSIHGRIASEWRRERGRFELRLTIPANCSATLYQPAAGAASVSEGGQPLASVRGVKYLRQEGGCAVLFVESGTYLFVSSGLAP